MSADSTSTALAGRKEEQEAADMSELKCRSTQTKEFFFEAVLQLLTF